MLAAIAKLLVLVLFVFGAVVALLWIPIELADSVADGADWIWFLALVLTVVPALLFLVAAIRSRSRGVMALTVLGTALVVGVVLTYPAADVACKSPAAGQSAAGQGAGNGAGTKGLGAGVLVEDDPTATDSAAVASNCR